MGDILVTTLVSSKRLRGRLNVRLIDDSGNVLESQLSSTEGRDVAFSLMAGAAIADQDALLVRFLMKRLNMSQAQATQALLAFRQLREEEATEDDR